MVHKESELTPQQYFDAVKERKHKINDKELQDIYDNCLELLNKYIATGQNKAVRKLMFHLDCIEKERKIVAKGIDTFIYRDDIEYYIDKVAKDIVKIQDIGSYEREIPDEIVEVIVEFKDVFDQMYIVFTDYTGKAEREVEKERREKDPILFGTFESPNTQSINDRFWFLGDWQDEFCDLTLDKMVNETDRLGKRNIKHIVKTPEDIEELKAQLNGLVPKGNSFVVDESKPKRKNFFKNIRSFGKK